MSDYVMGRTPLIKQKLNDAIDQAHVVKSIGIRDHNNTVIRDGCNDIINITNSNIIYLRYKTCVTTISITSSIVGTVKITTSIVIIIFLLLFF